MSHDHYVTLILIGSSRLEGKAWTKLIKYPVRAAERGAGDKLPQGHKLQGVS